MHRIGPFASWSRNITRVKIVKKSMKTNSEDPLSTGSKILDYIIGGPGIPGGRMVELFGREETGKSTLSLSIVAQAREQPGNVLLVDTEQTLSPSFIRRSGVDPDSVILSRPGSAEEAFDVIETLLRSGGTPLIVIDSVAALTPRAEIRADLTADTSRSLARILTEHLRKLSPLLKRGNAVLLMTNQLRARPEREYGPEEDTPGGRALKFYTDLRIHLEDKQPIRVNGNQEGIRVRARMVKNRIAPPFKEVILDIRFDTGLDPLGTLVNSAFQFGVFPDPEGSTFEYEEWSLPSGYKELRETVSETPELRDHIQTDVIRKIQDHHRDE